MLTRETLVNITVFMERAQATGKEAIAWAQTYEAVVKEINAIDAKRAETPPPKEDSNKK